MLAAQHDDIYTHRERERERESSQNHVIKDYKKKITFILFKIYIYINKIYFYNKTKQDIMETKILTFVSSN